jgi:hypothetical protein
LYEPQNGASLADFVERTPAYGLENLLLVEDGGQIRAALGYWDWSRITRLTVQALSLKIRLLGLALDVAGWFRPMPSGVKAGDTLKQAVLTPIAYRAPEDLRLLMHRVNNRCLTAGIGQIFSVFDRDPTLEALVKDFITIDTDLHLLVKPLRAGLALGSGPIYLDGKDL